MTKGQLAALSVMSHDEYMTYTEVESAIIAKYGDPQTFWFNTLQSLQNKGLVENLPRMTIKCRDKWRLK